MEKSRIRTDPQHWIWTVTFSRFRAQFLSLLGVPFCWHPCGCFDVQMVAQYQVSDGFVFRTGANVEMFMESSKTSFSKSACFGVQMLTGHLEYEGFVLCTGS